MCGIVGLYLKNPQLESRLGELFEPMLIAMTGRTVPVLRCMATNMMMASS